MIDVIVGTLSMTATLTPLIISLMIIHRVSSVTNFGAGFFVVFAGALGSQWDAGSSILAAAATIVVGAALGVACYGVAVAPAQARQAKPINLTISTLGFGLLLGWFTRERFGGAASTLSPWVHGFVSIGSTRVSQQRLLVIALAGLLLLLLYILFDRTIVGRALTAVAHDEELAGTYGLRSARYKVLGWAVGGGCAAIAGLFTASISSVSVDNAPVLLVYALVGSVAGGIGSFAGSVGGAFVVALPITLAARYMTGTNSLTIAFVIVVVLLAVRPNGLLSFRSTAERV